MKRKILALVCAAVMSLGMSMTVFAAGSTDATQAAYTAPIMSTGTQTFSAATIAGFATVTTASGNATVTAVNTEVAASAVAEANAVYGNDSFVASVVDISLPADTVFPYELTITNPNVWSGQAVTILHYVNGAWERLTPSAVGDNTVTVTITSCSPFAVVVDTQPSPRTMVPAMAVCGLAGLFAAGAVLTGKKKER